MNHNHTNIIFQDDILHSKLCPHSDSACGCLRRRCLRCCCLSATAAFLHRCCLRCCCLSPLLLLPPSTAAASAAAASAVAVFAVSACFARYPCECMLTVIYIVVAKEAPGPLIPLRSPRERASKNEPLPRWSQVRCPTWQVRGVEATGSIAGLQEIYGARYKCSDCPNFDYCFKCKNSSDQTHVGHRSEKFK